MTVKLELTPEVQAGLLAQAQQNGLSLEAYAEKCCGSECMKGPTPL
jgi:hypothetical protein